MNPRTMQGREPAGLALLFPGQGAQRPGMGQAWCEIASWSLVADLSEWSGQDVEHLLLRADAEQLRRTDVAQLAVFALSMIAHREFVHASPEAVIHGYAGHSLGEYSALAAAGALSLRAATELVVARGRAMLAAANRTPGTMAVIVGAAAEDLETAVEEARAQGARLWIANSNAPGQLVVSGETEAVEAFAAQASRLGGKAVRIPVGGAFHSPLMESAAAALAERLAATPFTARHRPVVANVDARVHTGGRDWPRLALRQLTGRVRWAESVATLVRELGCAASLELGTGKTLTGMVTRIAPGLPAEAADSPERIRAALAALPGPPVPHRSAAQGGPAAVHR
ncbi:MAG TPA: ACP S-malonyltransferase [Actinospica sp.]|jgi:[acyl-carrier-protein] S-malonyltransferase|nr:ACP S-malonyltransferase [Actinospica sp.]